MTGREFMPIGMVFLRGVGDENFWGHKTKIDKSQLKGRTRRRGMKTGPARSRALAGTDSSRWILLFERI